MDADIQNSEGKTICSFRQMVEEAIECWEDFCLTHLPKTSHEIQKRREIELTNIKTAEAIKIRLPQVNDILNKQDNWVLCPKDKITPGTMVSVFKLDNDKRIWRGFVSRIIEGDTTLVRVTDPSMGLDSSYNIDKHLFYQLLPENPEEFYFVSNHYLELRDFRAEQLNRSKNA